MLAEPAARGPRVVFCSPAAVRSRVRPGMPVAEALALDYRLQVIEQDGKKDRGGLLQLAAWATRYSPAVGPEDGPAPESLLLDITGCGPCFGGEDRLLHRAARELKEQGWNAHLAVADTLGAAWGLAHRAATPYLAAPGETESALRPLPVAALRLPSTVSDLLARLGIERIGDLIELPRADLPIRFGPEVLRRLDQALGRLPEVLTPHRPLPDLQVVFAFEYPTERLDVLKQALGRLTEQIRDLLQDRDWGARRMECWLYHEAAPPQCLEVGLSRATRSPQYLHLLLGSRLEQAPLAAPVLAISLRVISAEPRRDFQDGLFETERPPEKLAALIDHLSSRLGDAAVTHATLVPDPQPEFACRFDPVIQFSAHKPVTPNWPLYRRPLWLCPTPVPLLETMAADGSLFRFRWAKKDYHVRRLWGPERIATGWWRGTDVQRDYYVVETTGGSRFWIFRQPEDGRWFLHGCFD